MSSTTVNDAVVHGYRRRVDDDTLTGMNLWGSTVVLAGPIGACSATRTVSAGQQRGQQNGQHSRRVVVLEIHRRGGSPRVRWLKGESRAVCSGTGRWTVRTASWTAWTATRNDAASGGTRRVDRERVVIIGALDDRMREDRSRSTDSALRERPDVLGSIRDRPAHKRHAKRRLPDGSSKRDRGRRAHDHSHRARALARNRGLARGRQRE
jgi:hypothetical protein